MTDIVSSIANAAAAAGVVVVIWQLLLRCRQLVATIERTFVDKYDRIFGRVALPMLLGENVDVRVGPTALRKFFDNLERCAGELCYRRIKRNGETWTERWEGIALHLRQLTFGAAWNDLRDRMTVRPDGPASGLPWERPLGLR